MCKKSSGMQKSYVWAIFHAKQFLLRIFHLGSLCTWRKIENNFSRFQFEGKNDVWISQVRRVKWIEENAFDFALKISIVMYIYWGFLHTKSAYTSICNHLEFFFQNKVIKFPWSLNEIFYLHGYSTYSVVCKIVFVKTGEKFFICNPNT